MNSNFLTFILLLISWMFPVAVIAYLIFTVRLFHKIKNNHKEYWEYLGSPSLSDPNGQIPFLWKVVCGKDLSESVAASCKTELMAVRILFCLCAILFVIITVMIFSGYYDKYK